MGGDRSALEALFQEERRSAVRAMNRALVAYERDPSRKDLLQDLFRNAHSLKGAAQAMGDQALATRCHQLEESLTVLRRAGADPEHFGRLYDQLDGLAGEAPPRTPVDTPDVETPHALRTDPPVDKDGPSKWLRVPPARLDEALRQADTLLLAAQLVETSAARRAADLVGDLADKRATHALRYASAALGDTLRGLRMAPFAEACEGLERVARDVAASLGKIVRLTLRHEDVELDRAVLHALHQPLVHLVRNAVHHGIEEPGRREAGAKPRAGTVEISATLTGGNVVVAVRDDGAGADLPALRREAAARGIPAPGNDQDALDLVFQPGLSTASSVSEVSGRGVGLDAVRASVERIGGAVSVDSVPGSGLTVRLTVPLTMSTTQALLVAVNAEVLALPLYAVRRVASLKRADLPVVEGTPALPTPEGPAPLRLLSAMLGWPPPAPSGEQVVVVLVTDGRQQVGLVVDALLGHRDIVVAGLGPRLSGAPTMLGATPLEDGRPALVLNAAVLVRTALRVTRGGLPQPESAPVLRRRILLAEDSAATRALERMILEAAGYEVVEARDGAEAWAHLQGSRVDAVLTDVDMPGLSGIELCGRIRADVRLRGVPVVLLTSLASEKDRRLGLEAGADAYHSKGAFDQGQLLETIERLL